MECTLYVVYPEVYNKHTSNIYLAQLSNNCDLFYKENSMNAHFLRCCWIVLCTQLLQQQASKFETSHPFQNSIHNQRILKTYTVVMTLLTHTYLNLESSSQFKQALYFQAFFWLPIISRYTCSSLAADNIKYYYHLFIKFYNPYKECTKLFGKQVFREMKNNMQASWNVCSFCSGYMKPICGMPITITDMLTFRVGVGSISASVYLQEVTHTDLLVNSTCAYTNR